MSDLDDNIEAMWIAINALESQLNEVKVKLGLLISAALPTPPDTTITIQQETPQTCFFCQYHGTGVTQSTDTFDSTTHEHYCNRWQRAIPSAKVKQVKCDDFAEIDYNDDIPF